MAGEPLLGYRFAYEKIKHKKNMKLTFLQWLILLKPETRLKITMPDGIIYEGKSEAPLKFHMEFSGFNFGIMSGQTGA